jgi:hypothetical protein
MAMNSTYRALMTAGFNAENFPRLQDIMFITEPEAAAQYTARHYRDEERNVFLEVTRQSIASQLYGTDIIHSRKDNISFFVTQEVVRW